MKTDGTVQLSLQIITKPGTDTTLQRSENTQPALDKDISLICLFSPCPGEEKLNILEIVKPVETVEVVIDPDAAGEEGTLVEEGQLIAVERSGLSDETSEQVTRWAAALEGYRKEQVRLGIPYGEERLNKTRHYWEGNDP